MVERSLARRQEHGLVPKQTDSQCTSVSVPSDRQLAQWQQVPYWQQPQYIPLYWQQYWQPQGWYTPPPPPPVKPVGGSAWTGRLLLALIGGVIGGSIGGAIMLSLL
jgi:hypothetical protein